MDPLSQGLVGATASLSLSSRHTARLAALAGAAGGMLADLDILIRSDSDPLLNIEYHRHFTHALLFIPVGGLVAALALYPFLRRRLSKLTLYLYATAGYATAGLLDAFTSYGTQLLWPFSDARVAWNLISVIDPLFTLPLLLLVALGLVRRSSRIARWAAAFACLYLLFGFIQNRRAASLQSELLVSRGHLDATAETVKPSIANLIVWRSVYLFEGEFHVDALRVGLFGPNKVYPGESLPAFDLQPAIEALPADSPLAADLRRFNHFSDGYLAALPDEPHFLTDLRYSAIPNRIDPLWGLDLSQTTDTGHALFETRRNIDEAARQDFLIMLKGE